MAQLTVSIVGTKELQRRLRKMNPEVNQSIMRKSFLDIAADLIDDISNVQIVGGRGDAPPLPNRLTNRHGGRGLVGSIALNMHPFPRYAEVGTHLNYGATHEKGLRGYPVRAFLKPARDKIAPRIPAMVVANWKKYGGL